MESTNGCCCGRIRQSEAHNACDWRKTDKALNEFANCFLAHIFWRTVQKRWNPPNSYVLYIFTLKTVHKLHLGFYRLIKTGFISYLSSATLLLDRNGNHDTTAVSIRKSVLRVFNNILSARQNLFPTPGLNVYSAQTEPFAAINGLFAENDWKGMLEGKDYISLDWIFHLLGPFADRFLGPIGIHGKAKFQTMYTQLRNGKWCSVRHCTIYRFGVVCTSFERSPFTWENCDCRSCGNVCPQIHTGGSGHVIRSFRNGVFSSLSSILWPTLRNT